MNYAKLGGYRPLTDSYSGLDGFTVQPEAYPTDDDNEGGGKVDLETNNLNWAE